ncbi:MAG: DUF3303 domain-containing protein [Candidatus Zixiibacteriota bacterium]
MLYMIIETFHPGKVRQLYRRFEQKGRMLPEGMLYVNSWIDIDMTKCFQVLECDDPARLVEWTQRWNDLAEFEVIPVLTSEQARERALES